MQGSDFFMIKRKEIVYGKNGKQKKLTFLKENDKLLAPAWLSG